MNLVQYIISSALWFAVGRFSYICWKNSYLENKRAELYQYRDELLAISHEIDKEKNRLRKMWQNMVVDLSKYEFANKNEPVWTEKDDLYFRSWNSAEE